MERNHNRQKTCCFDMVLATWRYFPGVVQANAKTCRKEYGEMYWRCGLC